MSGRNRFEMDWDRIKSHAGLLRNTADIAINQVTNQIHYIMRTSSSERMQASIHAEAYQAEMLKFLSQQSMQRIQGILHLSNPQVAVTEFLLERYQRGKLLLTQSRGRIGQTGLPYIVKSYESTLGREQPMTLHSLLDESKRSKNASLTIRWGTRSPVAHGFHIFGQVGSPLSGMQDFVTLPSKANHPNELQTLMGLAPDAYGMTQHIYVFDGGERFVIDKTPKRGNTAGRISEYVLLGNFRGNHTKLHHWMYGLKQ